MRVVVGGSDFEVVKRSAAALLEHAEANEKLINAFVGVIEKNYKDTSGIAADMETFKAYFTRDAQDKDVIVFSYCPGKGLTTTLNGVVSGVIPNPDFAEALGH